MLWGTSSAIAIKYPRGYTEYLPASCSAGMSVLGREGESFLAESRLGRGEIRISFS